MDKEEACLMETYNVPSIHRQLLLALTDTQHLFLSNVSMTTKGIFELRRYQERAIVFLSLLQGFLQISAQSFLKIECWVRCLPNFQAGCCLISESNHI